MREELARLLSDGTVKDPRLTRAMITVTEVRITSDLEHAKVFISTYGDEDGIKEALRGLKSAAGVIRREVTQRLGLRFAPELTFELDDSIERGARIETVLKEIAAEAPAAQRVEDEADPRPHD